MDLCMNTCSVRYKAYTLTYYCTMLSYQLIRRCCLWSIKLDVCHLSLGHSLGSIPVAVKNIPFAQALALQSSGRNCNPAPDLVLWKLIFPSVIFSGGMFFHRHRYLNVFLRWMDLTPSRRCLSQSRSPWFTTCMFSTPHAIRRYTIRRYAIRRYVIIRTLYGTTDIKHELVSIIPWSATALFSQHTIHHVSYCIATSCFLVSFNCPPLYQTYSHARVHAASVHLLYALVIYIYIYIYICICNKHYMTLKPMALTIWTSLQMCRAIRDCATTGWLP